MKKILIFGYTMHIGGAEKALIDLMKTINNKCEIDLYLLEKEGTLLKEIPKNVNVYSLKKNVFQYALFRYIPFFRKRTINKIANLKDYEIALAYMEGRCGTWITDIKKIIKKYAWIHNDVDKFGIGISEKEIKKTYNNVDKIICVSVEAKKKFCNKYNINSNKVDVIYNFINEKDILRKAKEIKIAKNLFTFVNVAKMRDQKRQDKLIEAAKVLKSKGYTFQINLVGDGPNLDKIKKLATDSNVLDVVNILGLKENPYPYILNSDCFILVSDMEGYGIVIKEALFLKKRIITTDVVGPREILEDGKYGIIIPNDIKSIINTMESVMKNKGKYNYLDEALKKYKGDNNKIIEQINKLLELE